jgi:hypothetical protein
MVKGLFSKIVKQANRRYAAIIGPGFNRPAM